MRAFNPEIWTPDHDPPNDSDHGANVDYAYCCLILIALAVAAVVGISAYGCSMVIGL